MTSGTGRRAPPASLRGPEQTTHDHPINPQAPNRGAAGKPKELGVINPERRTIGKGDRPGHRVLLLEERTTQLSGLQLEVHSRRWYK